MNEFDFTGFRIVTHAYHTPKSDGGRVGYHCPNCGCFYAEGNFTIENPTHVLGNPDSKTCCGKIRPTPRVFETVEEAKGFLSMFKVCGVEISGVQIDGVQIKATVIAKRALIIAHFNQKLVAEQRKKVLR